jgi:hypothetical protein
MPIRRPTRTAQLALAAAAAWAVVVVPYAVSLLLDLFNYGGTDDWDIAFSDIPAAAIFVVLPVIAHLLSVALSIRLLYGEETPRDRSYAIALFGPALAWVALVALQYLS